MAKTQEEQKRQRELASAYSSRRDQAIKRYRKGLRAEEAAFIEDLEERTRDYEGMMKSKYTKAFADHVNGGGKPSKFIAENLDFLFTGYIPARYREHVLWMADTCIDWQYASGYDRRAFRIPDYRAHIGMILFRMFEFAYHLDDVPLADSLALQNVPEDLIACVEQYSWNVWGYHAAAIAYELDHGNKAVEEAIIAILNGESRRVLQHDIIRGIVQSHNTKMHEYLGKLLLAARLQEGLRQAICECADCGTIEAFRSILNVIRENDLIRFSSVKRAVGVWVGLLPPDSKDLDRITSKTLELLCDCLDSEETRSACLQTEDSLAIYLALCAQGFHNVNDAAETVIRLAGSGTHHQLLTAGYFLSNLHLPKLAHDLAKAVVKQHASEQDVLAVYMPHFMAEWRSQVPVRYYSRKKVEKTCWDKGGYYANETEAAEFFGILSNIYDDLPKKDKEFSPIIFPWLSAVLTRSHVAICLCVTAWLLHDDEKLDAVAALLPQIEVGSRSSMLNALYAEPHTPMQRRAVVQAICDKEEYTRDNAYKMAEKFTLTADEYALMEDLLRYKYADARERLIGLLMRQDDTALLGCIARLLADKKEEKRAAGLDMVLQLGKDEKRAAAYESAKTQVAALKTPTGKEQILIDQIIGAAEEALPDEHALYSEADLYAPEIPDTEYTRACVDVFMRYFPDSQLKDVLAGKKSKAAKGVSKTAKQAAEDLASLRDLIEAHANDEYRIYNGEMTTIGTQNSSFREYDEGGSVIGIAGKAIWHQWYAERIGSPERMLRAVVLYRARVGNQDAESYTEAMKPILTQFFGAGFEDYTRTDYQVQMMDILNHLGDAYTTEWKALNTAALLWFVKAVPQDQVFQIYQDLGATWQKAHDSCILNHSSMIMFFNESGCRFEPHADERFALSVLAGEKAQKGVKISEWQKQQDPWQKSIYMSLHIPGPNSRFGAFKSPEAIDWLRAYLRGDISERTFFSYAFQSNQRREVLRLLSGVNSFVRDDGKQRAKRGGYSAWHSAAVYRPLFDLLDKKWAASYRLRDIQKAITDSPFTDEEREKLNRVADLFDKMIGILLPIELHRGDTATQYSDMIRSTERIYGMENFLDILTALGKEPLARSTYYSAGDTSKKVNLSYLLGVCVPNAGDDAEKLRKMMQGRDISEQRLIEAALFSPEWLEIVDGYLGWEGFIPTCYYFMAHMNETFDDRRKAMIAKFTPLTEEELHLGAFDIEWFRSAYAQIGQKRFEQIYKAAKYITDGSKHARAQKYADAVLGKLDAEQTAAQIDDKRNKDLLMAFALIPFADEDALSKRYLRIVQYQKEARKFGAQRSASERKAASVALQNLAMNAGYADVMRLTLRMETKLLEDSRAYFDGIEIEGYTVKLAVDAEGAVTMPVEKDGKALKSVPAKLKKNEQILAMTETKKNLTEQYRRTRLMMEQAMEEETTWKAEEIAVLLQNPVVAPILSRLVYSCDGKFGFFKDMQLLAADGTAYALQPDSALLVAHPYALYSAGVWIDYQKAVLEQKTVQPFKQVFRELYVKTDEERSAVQSVRYAGNQIQPAKTVACLKTRRWIADVENGLQKVFYKENIIATIYALADWFSPADIEAPTLEWVAFYHRKTYEPIRISDVPDVLFSEVMRDVDLAVSVAHAGEVDPETSHSTVEMRAALLQLSLPLLQIKNVEISGNHALIAGTRADYTVHLGSGVCHQKGGAMLNILPVHSQHRGRIFLPFADDDPKTAEILSKVILLSEDKKIKDPSILSQIQ